MSKIDNTQTDHAKDIGIAMPMYNLIEYIKEIKDKLMKTKRIFNAASSVN